MRDITEQLKATQKIEEEKQRLELAIWSADLGLWDWNIPTGDVTINERWATMLGYRKEEILPKVDSWTQLVHPDDLPVVVQGVQPMLAGDTHLYQSEHRMRCKDGSWKWILDSGKVIARDTDGIPIRVIGTHLDITQRKEYEAAMQHLNEELEQKVTERTAQLQAVNKELEAFSYSVSHDLRAPLRSIDGFSKVLLSDYQELLDQDGKEYLHTIRAASQRMGLLIDDLLKLARISRSELVLQPVNLSEMADRILAELQEQNPGREIRWQIAPAMVVEADHRLLHIALYNLLSNAWKYTAKNKEAFIEVGKTDTQQKEAIFIKDNGAGFDMRYADKLFGAFQRMHTNHEFEGTGIGLAIVQRIILKHGGEIWVEAAPEKGARFFFTLPAIDYATVKELESE